MAGRISVSVKSSAKRQRNILGPLVKRLREAKGVTQLELAATLQREGWDISRQVLGFIEDGSRIVSDIELFSILRALGQSPDVLREPFEAFSATRRARKKS